MVGSGGGSQRLINLNPTTVIVVLLLGLWLLLGCDNYDIQALAGESEYERTPSKETAITNNENDQIRESVINHNEKCCNCTRERLKD